MRKRNQRPSAFERCANKTFTSISDDSGEKYNYVAFDVALTCAGNADGTKSEAATHQREGQRDIENIVGETICSTCVFANLDPLETARYRLELAQTRVAAAEAESQALRKERQHKALLAEIQQRVEIEAGQQQPVLPPAPETPQP